MERVLSQDERIRRAEEIYARRQNLRERTKKATLNVSNEPKNAKVIKKIILQAVICTLIYCIFYLVNTTNYSFSEEILGKTEELISEDVDFINIYNNMINNIKNYIASLNESVSQMEKEAEETKEEQNNAENEEKNEIINNNEEIENQISNQEEIKDETIQIAENQEETTSQEKLEDVTLSETDRIKQNYSFVNPVSR